MREHTADHESLATEDRASPATQEPRSPVGDLLQLQRLAGNGAVTRLVVQREPYSEAGAAQRAHEIDEQVRANPSMPVAELERLMRERDRVLPLMSHPPETSATPPAGPPAPAAATPVDPGSRWAATPPPGMDGAVPLAMGVVMVPVTSGPPPVPPSVLFPELAETGVAASEVGGLAATGTEAGLAAAELGAGAAELGTVATVAGGSSVVPVVGWIVAGVIVVGIVGYLVYRHYSGTAPAPGRPERVEAPGAGPSDPRLAPGAPNGGPVSLPSAGTATGPMSLPGAPNQGPVSLPGAPGPDGPVLASGLPTHRTDFATREAARARAEQLARGVVNGQLEVIDQSPIYGTPEEQGNVTYYRVVGSTAEMRGPEPRGNIVCIVEHTSDPTQPPHFHVVRPPTSGPRIEHGGVYFEPFAGTSDQHLTVNPAGARR